MINLKAYRQSLGKTGVAVARAAGLQRKVYLGIESGRINPRPDELAKIAEVLGVTDPAWLTGRVELDPPEGSPDPDVVGAAR